MSLSSTAAARQSPYCMHVGTMETLHVANLAISPHLVPAPVVYKPLQHYYQTSLAQQSVPIGCCYRTLLYHLCCWDHPPDEHHQYDKLSQREAVRDCSIVMV